MVAPIWEKLESIEQHLDRLDLALNTILKHLNITLPGAASDTSTELAPVPEARSQVGVQISDTPYEYKALDRGSAEIRLLALNNTNDDSESISGSLVNFSLEEKQAPGTKRYNALSYTWGPPKMDCRILIDGHPFFVTQNLDSALRQMRKTANKASSGARDTSNQTLWWIDQICKSSSLRPFLACKLMAYRHQPK